MSDSTGGVTVAQVAPLNQRQSSDQPVPKHAAELILDQGPDDRYQMVAAGGPGINLNVIASKTLENMAVHLEEARPFVSMDENGQVQSARQSASLAYARHLQESNTLDVSITDELSEDTHVRDLDFEASVRMLARMLDEGGDQALLSFAQGAAGVGASGEQKRTMGMVSGKPGGGLPGPNVP